MYKLILLISILGLVMYKRNIIEPIVASCCGGVKAHENNPRAPKNIRRCLKNEEWYMPCTNKGSPDCCSGEDRCIPSSYGGKCKKKDGSGYYIYDGNKKKEYDRTSDDTEVYDDDDDRSRHDLDEDKSDIYDKLFKLDYLNYFIIFCVGLFILYLIYHLFIEGTFKTRHNISHTKHSSSYRPNYSRYEGYNKNKYWKK